MVPGAVKISRREVRALLVAAVLLVRSNAAVRWLLERVAARAFVPRLPLGALR